MTFTVGTWTVSGGTNTATTEMIWAELVLLCVRTELYTLVSFRAFRCCSKVLGQGNILIKSPHAGRIHPTDDIEEVVARHFQEWGTIERVRVLPTRGVAFVTYTTESLAQFAKEAMAHQALDNSEILNVRWATQDPNPQAQKREARKIEEQAAEAIRRALPEAFVREIEGRDPEAKRRRKDEGTFGLEGYEASDEVWFASEKAKLAMERGQQAAAVEAPPQPQMIQDGTSSTVFSHGGGGILSASTLAAIQSYEPDSSRFASKSISGPLVAYGSDDEEDD